MYNLLFPFLRAMRHENVAKDATGNARRQEGNHEPAELVLRWMLDRKAHPSILPASFKERHA
jgi:hypothetical protein